MNFSSFLLATALSLILIVYISFYGNLPANCHDLHLWLPISLDWAQPGLFPMEDLIISSGRKIPFHFYRLIGSVYKMGVDIEMAIYGIYLTFLFLTFLSTWYLAFSVCKHKLAATMAVVLLATVEGKGTLNACGVPLSCLVTAHIALPLALFALGKTFNLRWLQGLLIGTLTFNIHPYIGLITLCLVATIFVSEAPTALSNKISWLFLAGLLCLPNVVYMLFNVSANFSFHPGKDSKEFYEIFKMYAFHVYIRDHWRGGYGWFFLNLAGAIYFAGGLPKQLERMTKRALTVLLFLCAVYLLNLYSVKYKGLLLTFLISGTGYFFKPLVLILLSHGVVRWLQTVNMGFIEKERKAALLLFSGTTHVLLLGILPILFFRKSHIQEVFVYSAKYFSLLISVTILMLFSIYFSGVIKRGKNKILRLRLAQAVYLGTLGIWMVSAHVPNIRVAEALCFLFYSLLLMHLQRGEKLVVIAGVLCFIISFFECVFYLFEALGEITVPDLWFAIFVAIHVLLSLPLALNLLITRKSDVSFHPNQNTRQPVGVFARAFVGLMLSALLIQAWSQRDFQKLIPVSFKKIMPRIRLTNEPESMRKLAHWVRSSTPKGSLFLIPPVNSAMSSFRVTAQRGVYVHAWDINQLAYDTTKYAVCSDRLKRLGVVKKVGYPLIEAPHYNQFSATELLTLHKTEGVDYAIFEWDANSSVGLESAAVFSDEHWIVYDLAHLEIT